MKHAEKHVQTIQFLYMVFDCIACPKEGGGPLQYLALTTTDEQRAISVRASLDAANSRCGSDRYYTHIKRVPLDKVLDNNETISIIGMVGCWPDSGCSVGDEPDTRPSWDDCTAEWNRMQEQKAKANTQGRGEA